jgi:DNA-binding NarL/FixJ family response regulator
VIRVFLVAASLSARRSLEARLDRASVDIVGSATELEITVEELADKQADVTVISVSQESREELLEALEETRLTQETHVVLLVHEISSNFWQQAIRVGVKSILPWEIDADSLHSALAAVAGGLVVLSPEDLGTVQTVGGRLVEDVESIESLTPREREVLRQIASGFANKEIAARMKISDHTVKFHVASILGKLGAASRTEAVSIGMRRGLILL